MKWYRDISDAEMEHRLRFIEATKPWIGTPFRDQSDILGAGVDCAMLMYRSGMDTGVWPEGARDPRPYPPRWHLRKGSDEMYLKWADEYATCVAEGEGYTALEYRVPGNMLVIKEGWTFSHGVLLLPDNQIIHAWYELGEVAIEHQHQVKIAFFPRTGKPRPFKIYDPWVRPGVTK